MPKYTEQNIKDAVKAAIDSWQNLSAFEPEDGVTYTLVINFEFDDGKLVHRYTLSKPNCVKIPGF
jgi:hypothetical protein